MTKRPHILITNDDGVNAPGIKHLWQALIEFADVTVIAPATEQSATALSITLRTPLQIDRIHWKSEFPVWTVNGTPADCIKLGLSMILEKKPDLIVSGINRGSNAGRNVLYSGTVAATIESVLQGVPAIAFSCYDYWDTDYTLAETHVSKIIHHTLDNPPPHGYFAKRKFPKQGRQRAQGIQNDPTGERILGRESC